MFVQHCPINYNGAYASKTILRLALQQFYCVGCVTNAEGLLRPQEKEMLRFALSFIPEELEGEGVKWEKIKLK